MVNAFGVYCDLDREAANSVPSGGTDHVRLDRMAFFAKAGRSHRHAARTGDAGLPVPVVDIQPEKGGVLSIGVGTRHNATAAGGRDAITATRLSAVR